MGAYRWAVNFSKSEIYTWTSCQVSQWNQVFSWPSKNWAFFPFHSFSQGTFFSSSLNIGYGIVLICPGPMLLAVSGKRNTPCYLGFYYPFTKRQQEIWKIASQIWKIWKFQRLRKPPENNWHGFLCGHILALSTLHGLAHLLSWQPPQIGAIMISP